MANPLIWLSGAQPDVLAQVKQDHPKYLGIGSAVLITSTMAAISMAFALHMALKASVVASVPFGLLWGLAIMSLDRWLVVSLVRQPGFRYLLLAVPRLLLGLLFGLIISTPITLQIFQVEIANQMNVDHTNALVAYQNSAAVKNLTAAVNADKAAVAKDQQTLSSGGGTGISPAADPTVQQDNTQLASDKAAAAKAYSAWHCEVYPAAACGPGYVAGNGQGAKADWTQYQTDTTQVGLDQQKLASDMTTLATQNTTDKGNAVSAATTNLTRDKTQLATDQSTLNTMVSKYKGTLAADTGILARLQALDELRMSSFTMFVSELLLFLFFTSIEWLPILVKVLLNFGPVNAYEKALADAEKVSLMRAENEQMTQYLRSVRETEEIRQESQDVYLRWRKETLPRLVEEELAARESVARYRLAQWQQRAMSVPLDDDTKDMFTPGGFSCTGVKRAPDWMARPAQVRRRQPLARLRLRPRLTAAWHAFRLSGNAAVRTTGPLRLLHPAQSPGHVVQLPQQPEVGLVVGERHPVGFLRFICLSQADEGVTAVGVIAGVLGVPGQHGLAGLQQLVPQEAGQVAVAALVLGDDEQVPVRGDKGG
jgi:hypothetical protein